MKSKIKSRKKISKRRNTGFSRMKRNPGDEELEEISKDVLIKEVKKLAAKIIEGISDNNYSKYLIPRIIETLSNIDDRIYEEITTSKAEEARYREMLKKERYF